jgi:hypothetical protein
MIPGLVEHLTEGTEDDVATIAEMVGHEYHVLLHRAHSVGVTKGHV